VADATLWRRLPGTIDVELRERVPMGIARAGTDLFLVDAAGTVIDEYGPRYADCDLPIIDGIIVTPVSATAILSTGRAASSSRLMSELRGPSLQAGVAELTRATSTTCVILEATGGDSLGRDPVRDASTRASASRRRCGSRCRTSVRGRALRRTRPSASPQRRAAHRRRRNVSATVPGDGVGGSKR
jgi:hypothetical protein